jgi:hypothetical protein
VCKLEKHNIYLQQTGDRGSFDNAVVYFDGLNPFTNYTIIFQRNIQNHQMKKFQTAEGGHFKDTNSNLVLSKSICSSTTSLKSESRQ